MMYETVVLFTSYSQTVDIWMDDLFCLLNGVWRAQSAVRFALFP